MLNVASATWSFADDIVFGNLSLVLFANGCKWGCPGCHNKKLQCFEESQPMKDPYLYVTQKLSGNQRLIGKNITVVGSGGDFFFQLEEWRAFCARLKKDFPDIKIVWYTGTDYSERHLVGDVSDFDAILWGRLNNTGGKVIKQVSLLGDSHVGTTPIIVSDYREIEGEMTT